MQIKFEFEAGDKWLTLAELRRRTEAAYLKHLIPVCDTRSAAAAVLGISRKNLWERLRALGLGSLKTHLEDNTVTKPTSIAA